MGPFLGEGRYILQSTSSVPKKKVHPFCDRNSSQENGLSQDPNTLLEAPGSCAPVDFIPNKIGPLLWLYGVIKDTGSELRLKKKCHKWAKNSKTKIFKNPPKIQFCSDIDGLHIKIFKRARPFRKTRSN